MKIKFLKAALFLVGALCLLLSPISSKADTVLRPIFQDIFYGPKV